jgi:hypothetical protein
MSVLKGCQGALTITAVGKSNHHHFLHKGFGKRKKIKIKIVFNGEV